MAAPPTSTTEPWCVISDLPARARDTRYDLDLTAAGEVFDWIQVASDVLFNFTRRRWPGPTEHTIRPITADWHGVRPTSMQLGEYGVVVDIRRGTTITEDGVSEILLPNHPAVSITTITIDGATLDAARYRIDNYRRLVYLPAAGESRSTWPSWQNLDAATTEVGTWQVVYKWGTAPPEGGKRACAELATELAILSSPKVAGQSRLPQRQTSVSRQGVSASAADPVTLFADDQTGLSTVDLWIAAVNNGARRRRGRVVRLGHPSHRRPT